MSRHHRAHKRGWTAIWARAIRAGGAIIRLRDSARLRHAITPARATPTVTMAMSSGVMFPGNSGSADARNPGHPSGASSSSPRSRAGFTASMLRNVEVASKC